MQSLLINGVICSRKAQEINVVSLEPLRHLMEREMNKEINDLKQQIMWLQNQNASLINRQEALRDHFAGLAMQELMAADVKVIWDNESIAELSYDMADAMLAEREKNG